MDKTNSFDFTILTKEELDIRFEKIKKEATSEKTPKQIAEIIRRHTINRMIFGSELPKSLEFFRVTIPSFDEFDQTKMSCFSFPTVGISTLGRANIKGFPVLYCSAIKETAIKEMKDNLTVGDEFYISCWELDPKSKLFLHSLMQNNKIIQEEGFRKSIAESLINQINKFSFGLKSLPENYRDSILYMNQKFGDLFALEGLDYYHLTSVYAHEILYRLDSVILQKPVIMYPSQEGKNNGINFAFPTSVVNSKQIVPKSIIKVKYNYLSEEGNINVSISEKGDVEGDKVIWNKHKYRIDKIYYNNLKLTTYNNDQITGKKVAKKKLKDTFIAVSNLCFDKVVNAINETEDDNIGADINQTNKVNHSKIFKF